MKTTGEVGTQTDFMAALDGWDVKMERGLRGQDMSQEDRLARLRQLKAQQQQQDTAKE